MSIAYLLEELGQVGHHAQPWGTAVAVHRGVQKVAAVAVFGMVYDGAQFVVGVGITFEGVEDIYLALVGHDHRGAYATNATLIEPDLRLVHGGHGVSKVGLASGHEEQLVFGMQAAMASDSADVLHQG